MSELVTTFSDAHREMVRVLENMGHELLVEIEFPPYRVDIYLPDIHAVVEVDGPNHSRKGNRRRDWALVERYCLPTFRLKAGQVKSSARWKSGFLAFVKACTPTAGTRWDRCKLKTPWL